MKEVLVIGGVGYIGSRIIHDLHHSYNMQSIDLSWFSKNTNYNCIKDYRNLTTEYIKKFDVIILLAGHSSVKMCSGEIASSWKNNITNFIGLVNKLDKSQLLIYASSGTIYGSNTNFNKEDMFLQFNPINNYDLTKYVLDSIAEKFILTGYQIIGFRFGSVNGWSPNIRSDIMINSMITQSYKNNIININNKNTKRPILGIADISRAINAVIEIPVSGIYNLASFSNSVEDNSNFIQKLTNSIII